MRTVNRAATRRIGDLVQALERRTLLSGSAEGLFPGMPGASVDTGLSYTHGTVIADLTRDGIPDLVGLSFTTLAVHPGLGNGRFGEAQYPSVPSFLSGGWPPASIHGFDLVEVNGDGRLDLAIDHSFSTGWSQSRWVGVLIQNADGSFAWPTITLANWLGVTKFVDLDSDGDLDFIESTPQLSVKVNDGLGVFTPAGSLSLPNLSGFSKIEVADFDADGLDDLLFGSVQIDILRRQSDGSYSIGATIPIHGYAVEVADIDGDDLPDLVTPTSASGWNDVSVIKNLGGWSFAPATLQGLVPGPIDSVAVQDVDHDGHLDVVTAFTRSSGLAGYISVHRMFASTVPPDPIIHEMGLIRSPTYNSLRLEDLNGDGFSDLIVNGYFVNQPRAAVLLNMRDGFFQAPALVTSGSGPLTTASADLDGDGLADVVSVNPVARSITLHRSLGRGAFAHVGTFGITGTPAGTWPGHSGGVGGVSLSLDDVNGDQRPDVVVAVEGFDRATLLSSAGVGVYAQSAVPLGSVVRSLQVADYDRDRRVDLLIDWGSGRHAWRKGLGNGAFAAVQSLDTAYRASSFFIDLNQDGVLDVVSKSPSAGQNHFGVQLGRPDGSFAAIIENEVAITVSAVDGMFVDIDGDDDPDVVGLGWTGPSLTIHRNRGDGTFESAYTTGVAPAGAPISAVHFRSADLDNDGHADLVGISAYVICVWRGLGGGLFDAPTWEQHGGLITSGPAIADFDGDTLPDIVTGSTDMVTGSTGFVRFLRNLRDAAPPNAVTLNPADDTGVLSDDQITRAETIRFAVTHDDPTARIELRRNGQLIAVRTGSGELVDPNVPAGTHAYTALAVVGNRESRATASLTVTIDRTAPAAPPAPVLQASSDSGVSNADRITNVTTPTFDIASTDSFYRAFVNGIQVGGDYLTGSFTAPALPEGVHIVSVRAVDAAGNVSEAGVDVTITIDTTAPTVAQSTFVFEVGHVLEFLFNDLVTGAPTTGHLTVTNLTTGAVVPSSLSFLNSLATFSFPQFASGLLREGNYRATLAVPNLTDRAGNVGTASATLDFHVLTADINRNRIVDFADLLAVAQNYGQFGRTFSQGNVDYSGDGFVGFNDLLTLAQSYGRSLLIAPAPEPSSRVGIFSRSKRRIGEELEESLG